MAYRQMGLRRPGPARFSTAVQAAEQNSDAKIDISTLADALKPLEIVAKLDDFIVGQADAKRAVAIAMRNRWRRSQLPNDLRGEVIPKNVRARCVSPRCPPVMTDAHVADTDDWSHGLWQNGNRSAHREAVSGPFHQG